MFDEIFNRWVTSRQLTQDDIIPVFLEWNQTFGDGKGTAQEVITLMHIIHVDYFHVLQYALKMIGIKKGYNWTEIYDTKTGRFVARFLTNTN